MEAVSIISAKYSHGFSPFIYNLLLYLLSGRYIQSDGGCSVFNFHFEILKGWGLKGYRIYKFCTRHQDQQSNNKLIQHLEVRRRWGEYFVNKINTNTNTYTSFSFNGRQWHLIFKCGYVDWKASLPFLLPWRLTYLEQCIVTKYSIGAIVPAPWAHWARAPDTATRLPAAQLLVSWYGARCDALGPEHSFINSSRSG